MLKKALPFILLVIGLLTGTAGTLLVQKFIGPKQTINIVGQAEVDAPADQANIIVSITNTSWSREQATADNKDEVQKLKDKLIALGISESRMTLWSNFEMMVAPNIPSLLIPPPSGIRGPIPAPIQIGGDKNNPAASTNLSITLDNISGIDKVFATINESPDAKITNTSYTLKSSSGYESQAREKALTDARNQAESIAKINHLRVGKLISLNNGYTVSPLNKEVMMGSGGQSTSGNNTVSYGEKTIPITVSYNVQ